MPPATVQNSKDFLGGAGMTTLQKLVASNFDTRVLRPVNNSKEDIDLRTNALLRHDEWKFIDERLRSIARDRLAGVADLQSAGLEINIGNLGNTSYVYEKVSDMTAATRHMNPAAFGQGDTLDFTEVAIPIPITSKPFEIDIRRLLGSRNRGAALDTTQVEVATRLVVDLLEDSLFQGASEIVISGVAPTGYANHADRATFAGASWATVANVDAAVRGAIAALEADLHFGPYAMYVHTDQYAEMRQHVGTEASVSALTQTLNRPEILSVKPSQAVTAGEAHMVQLTADVVQWGSVAALQTVLWEEIGGMVSKYLVMAGQIPILKSDANSVAGFCHITGI
jgi:uncharacterized linocin/CFP29 family protein